MLVEPTFQYQKGVGLIEVLVTMLILAVGLLGLAGLETQSLRYSHEAYLRTQTSVLAGDMIDRLRANSSIALTTNNYNFSLTDTPTGLANACETAACSGANLAAYDFKQWRDEIESQLPGGGGSVTPSTINAAGWREYTILIEFNGVSVDQGSGDPVKSTFMYRTRI
jgi:type IV pilus assembly protein PilV